MYATCRIVGWWNALRKLCHQNFHEIKREVLVRMAMATRVTGCSAQLPNAFLLTQRQQHFTFKKQQQQQQQHQRLLLSVTAAGTSLLSSSSSVIENINSVEEEKEEKNGNEKFEWSEHWYPVSLIEDLDPKVPTPFQLLGKQIVIWKDTVSDTWKAFIDKCPHRLAPLSEGRIDENGCLQCAYHGWSFRGDGTCARIPQADPSSQEAKAVLSPKACVSNTYPTIVSQGLLFVWPGDKGWEKSHSVQPPKLPSVFDNDPNFSTVTIQRDLFYGYDTLMENVSDPSHINFAHHKVTGRRDRAKPLPFKLTSTGYWGFTGCNSDTPKITAEFYAPCYVINKIEIPVSLPLQGSKVWEIYICSFNIPMAPGKTRSIVCSARNFFRFLMPGPAWWQLVPRWHEHWTSNKVYDGDMIVLQGQEKMLLASNQEYSRLTYTPTQADRLVIAFRSWLRRYGNGQPEWADDVDSKQPLPSTVLSKREMLDRYEQHTKKCSSCRGGLELFGVMEKIMLGVTITLAATAGIPTDKIFRIAMASACVMSGLLFFIFRELQQNFVFKDYVHAKID